MNEIDFSICIVLYKSPLKYIDENISQFHSSNIEYILVDNSEDLNYFQEVNEYLIRIKKRYFFNYKLIRAKKNGGYTQGNNIAFKYSSGRYILILNPDIVLDKKYFYNATKIMQITDWGIISPRILINNEYGLLFNGLILFCKYNPIMPINFVNSFKKEINNKSYNTFYAQGACFLVRRYIFKELNGFDESLFMYSDETDFCIKAKLHKFKVVYCPKLIAYHKNVQKPSLFAQKLILRNHLLIIGRYFSFFTYLTQIVFSFIRIFVFCFEKNSFRLNHQNLIPLFQSWMQGIARYH